MAEVKMPTSELVVPENRAARLWLVFGSMTARPPRAYCRPRTAKWRSRTVRPRRAGLDVSSSPPCTDDRCAVHHRSRLVSPGNRGLDRAGTCPGLPYAATAGAVGVTGGSGGHLESGRADQDCSPTEHGHPWRECWAHRSSTTHSPPDIRAAAPSCTFWEPCCSPTPELRSSLRRPVVAAGCVIAVLIGLSRVYLGYHWLTDVVGAWLLALILTSIGMAFVTAHPRPDLDAVLPDVVAPRDASSRAPALLSVADRTGRLVRSWSVGEPDSLMPEARDPVLHR